MRIQLTEFALDALSTFAETVRAAEAEPRIRVVIGKSKNANDKSMMIRAGLDRGEFDGISLKHEQSGLEFIFVQDVLSGLQDDLVVWLRNMDDLTLEITPRELYTEAMGDAQGKVIALAT